MARCRFSGRPSPVNMAEVMSLVNDRGKRFLQQQANTVRSGQYQSRSRQGLLADKSASRRHIIALIDAFCRTIADLPDKDGGIGRL